MYYIKNNWITTEVISSEALNHMETGIANKNYDIEPIYMCIINQTIPYVNYGFAKISNVVSDGVEYETYTLVDDNSYGTIYFSSDYTVTRKIGFSLPLSYRAEYCFVVFVPYYVYNQSTWVFHDYSKVFGPISFIKRGESMIGWEIYENATLEIYSNS